VDTHSDRESEEIVSKPRSKKRANKTHKGKPKPVASKRRDRKPVSESEASAERGFRPSRAWTIEAKREAVALLERGDISIEQLAAELGVGFRALREWQRQFEAEEKARTMTPQERLEFARIRRENERLRMENEILKKAATFFARHRS
jgi:transposase